MVRVLIHYEDHVVGNIYTLINQFVSYFDSELIVVDKVGHFNGEFAYDTLDNVIQSYSHWTWVFIDPTGNQVLDEFKHPVGDVVYAFGSDFDGFGELEFFGDVVRLRKSDVIFAHQALPLVLYDRSLSIMESV